MTQPRPYPGDPGSEDVVVEPVAPVARSLEYFDALNRPLGGHALVTPMQGPSFALPVEDGHVALAILTPGRYVVVGVLTDDEGRPHYRTDVVEL